MNVGENVFEPNCLASLPGFQTFLGKVEATMASGQLIVCFVIFDEML